jgi:hypothetical protein
MSTSNSIPAVPAHSSFLKASEDAEVLLEMLKCAARLTTIPYYPNPHPVSIEKTAADMEKSRQEGTWEEDKWRFETPIQVATPEEFLRAVLTKADISLLRRMRDKIVLVSGTDGYIRRFPDGRPPKHYLSAHDFVCQLQIEIGVLLATAKARNTPFEITPDLWERLSIDLDHLARCLRAERSKMDERHALVTAVQANAGGISSSARVSFDVDTQTVTLDNVNHKVDNSKAFALYVEILKNRPLPLTKAILQTKVGGCRGTKTIPKLLKELPERLYKTIVINNDGYHFDADANSKSSRQKRPRRKKGHA